MAAALLVALLGSCTPLDGRSPSVEVDADAAGAAATGASTPPWWATSTTAPAPTVLPAPLAPVPPVEVAAATTTSTTAPPAPTTTVATTVPPPPVTEAPPPAPAGAPTERDRIVDQALAPLGSARSRQVATDALEMVRFDWIARLPGWQLRFHDGRPGVRGLTFTGDRRIEVYVRSGDTPELLAHVVAHELGHAVDLTRLDDRSRTGWLAARGLRLDTLWFPDGAGVSDFASGAGDFAESFAWTFGPFEGWSGELGPPPTLLQMGLIALWSGAA